MWGVRGVRGKGGGGFGEVVGDEEGGCGEWEGDGGGTEKRDEEAVGNNWDDEGFKMRGGGR